MRRPPRESDQNDVVGHCCLDGLDGNVAVMIIHGQHHWPGSPTIRYEAIYKPLIKNISGHVPGVRKRISPCAWHAVNQPVRYVALLNIF